jgi:hypothetical protein
VAYTQAQLLDLLRRNVDADGWLQPILDDPNGAAALSAMLAQGERLSQSIDRMEALGLATTAPGGVPGVSTLTLTRAAAGTAGTIPGGYPFLDARGVLARTQVDYPVLATDLTIQLLVVSDRQAGVLNGEEDFGWRVSPDASVVMDVLATTVLIAPAGDPGLVATSFSAVDEGTPVEGSASDWLSVIGAERGARRQQDEDVGNYRSRVRNIPDAVSPTGLSEGALAASGALALPTVTILEPFDDQASTSAKEDIGWGSFQPLYSDGNTAPTNPFHSEFYDDAAREAISLREIRAYLRVVVPQPQDPATGLADFVPAPPAAATLPSVGVLGSLLALAEEVGRKRAAGVQVDVYVSEPKTLVGVGQTAAAVDTVVFTLTPIAGRAWFLRTGHAGHISYPSGVVLTLSMTHRVKFTFTDATTFTTPASGQFDEERLDPYKAAMSGFPYAKRINKIEGLLKGNGADIINMAGTFYVTEVVDP